MSIAPTEGSATGVCDVCGNTYDRMIMVTSGTTVGTFDSFECAIHAMAPTCEHCGCRVIGHGVETEGRIFCCANCARSAGETELVDRA
ncbi:hypothetical protein ACFWHT_13830 [Microbacterium sp. NPDC058342]|uniref:hypothetical protein n=1 Tax=Microbacterium sp. NPDC058342 TaxID=3346454 RepID=UPI0036484605